LSEVMNNITKRMTDSVMYIEPQKKHADIVIRYYTDDDISDLKIDNLCKIDPVIKLMITLNNFSNIYLLIEILEGVKNLNFIKIGSNEFVFSDEEFSSIDLYKRIIKKCSFYLGSQKNVETLLNKHDFIVPGFNGLIQSVTLFLAIMSQGSKNR